MRWKLLGGLAIFCGIMGVQEAKGWNATGHEVIAAIAWDHLTPAVKGKVTALLKAHPDYEGMLIHETTPEGEARDREAFLVAATWADVIRSGNLKSHVYSHPAWHYVDIPYVVGNVTPKEPTTMAWTAGEMPENVVQAIEMNEAKLGDGKASGAERAIALAWVEHLIGDIHQPLHTTSEFSETYPAGDRGGNSQIVSVAGQVIKLHAVWDRMLGGYMDLAAVEEMAKKLEAAHPPGEFARLLGEKDVSAWARESYEHAKRVVYLEGKLETVTEAEERAGKDAPALPEGYLKAGRAAAEAYGALAGYRLAAVLNEVMGG